MSRPFGHTIDMITFMIEQHAFKHLTANCNLATKHYSTWTSEMDKLCLSMFYFYLLLVCVFCFFILIGNQRMNLVNGTRQKVENFITFIISMGIQFIYYAHLSSLAHLIHVPKSREKRRPVEEKNDKAEHSKWKILLITINGMKIHSSQKGNVTLFKYETKLHEISSESVSCLS